MSPPGVDSARAALVGLLQEHLPWRQAHGQATRPLLSLVARRWGLSQGAPGQCPGWQWPSSINMWVGKNNLTALGGSEFKEKVEFTAHRWYMKSAGEGRRSTHLALTPIKPFASSR